MNFKQFLESNSDKVIKKGTVLYHGTLERYDSRKIKTGNYDNIFWTTDKQLTARTYIPSKGIYLSTTADSIIRDKDHKKIRESLGLTEKIINLAWSKDRKGYRDYNYWGKKEQEYQKQYRSNKDIDDDEFFNQWINAENQKKKSLEAWRQAESYLRSFVIMKMRSFGYEVQKGYFRKVILNKDGNLLHATHKEKGRVLQIICKRDFLFFDYASGKEGDLTNVDYHKISLFKKAESDGYDGIIINDFGQSDYLGNFDHISYGFFDKSLKDLEIKQIRNQSHPEDAEWGK